MHSRREFLKRALGSSVVLLAAACGQPVNPPRRPSAPAAAPKPTEAAKPAATTAPAAAATAAPAAAAEADRSSAKPAAAPANISGATVSLLQWNHFIPTADPFFKQQAEDWAKQTGVNSRSRRSTPTTWCRASRRRCRANPVRRSSRCSTCSPYTFAEGLCRT